MFKKLGLVSVLGLLCCAGCSAMGFWAITGGILNLGILAGGGALIAALPTIESQLQAIMTSLGI